jgi:CBS domain-containing protein
MIPLIPVKKVMSRDLLSVDSDATIARASQIMKQKKSGSLLVQQEGNFVGIITDVDMTRRVLAEGLDPRYTRVERVMSYPFHTVDVEDSIARANQLMTQHHIRHLVVVENGEAVGIVSARDLLEPVYEEEGGIPFWPNHALKEIAAAFLLIAFIGVLTLISPAPMLPKADPFSTPEHIKPEWYFLAAYELLKVADVLRFMGDWAPKAIGITVEVAFVILLFLIPFIDRNPERAYRKRPVAIAMGITVALTFFVFTIWGYIS